MGSNVVQSAHETSLFGCTICGGGGELFHHCCAACAEKVMEAWHGPATDQEFARWWLVYPRKDAKIAAQQAYRKARKRASADELEQGARAYAAKGLEKMYIAMPTTWLNQGRWMDEQESYDPGPKRDDTEWRVKWFVDKGMWLTTWGPRPDEPDAEPRVRKLYEEARA